MPRVFKERMKLSWPAFAPTQDRGAFDDFIPKEPPKYWRKLLIKKNEGKPVGTKQGVSAGSELQRGAHYIYPSTCGALTLAGGIIEFPPGKGSALSGAHMHTVEQVFYVEKGRCWFEIEGVRYDAEAGDWIFIPLFAKHCYMNCGTETLRLVFMKGVRLRGYDGPTEGPIDYREFDMEGEPDTPGKNK